MQSRVGDDTPLTAFADAIRDFSPDHLLVALRSSDHAAWQERHLLERLQETFRIPMTVFVELKVDGHSDRSAAAISDAIHATPEIVSAHIVSGSADFLLEVAVADLAHYERLMFETLLKLPNVADVRSNFALRTVKAPGPLPV